MLNPQEQQVFNIIKECSEQAYQLNEIIDQVKERLNLNPHEVGGFICSLTKKNCIRICRYTDHSLGLIEQVKIIEQQPDNVINLNNVGTQINNIIVDGDFFM